MDSLVRDFESQVEDSNGDTGRFTIGAFTIVRNDNELYDVYHHNKKKILEDLMLLSAAVAISTLLEVGDYAEAKQVLFLEQKFAKHYAELRFYSNAGKFDMAQNEQVDAEWCLAKIQSYVLPSN